MGIWFNGYWFNDEWFNNEWGFYPYMTTHIQGTGEQRIISATPPVARTDGATLPVEEISHYNWFMGFDGSPPELVGTTQLVNNEFTEAVDVDSTPVGLYELHYTTVDTEGRESVPSNVLVIEILPPIANPNPPTNVS